MTTLFQIVRGTPIYCQITDGMIGSSYRILPMTYHTEAYARRLAGAMHQRNYDACGDDWFYVIRAGEPALNRFGRENAIVAPAVVSDEVPF